MKAKINGNIVEVKTIEILGWTPHGRARCVEYENKEYYIIKRNRIWETLDPKNKIGPREKITRQKGV